MTMDDRMSAMLEELRTLAGQAENRSTPTGIPRLNMVKGEIPEHRLAAVYEPMVNLILDGAKTLQLGERTLRYDPASYFVISVELPVSGKVHQAGAGRPYLALGLTLSPELLRAVLLELPVEPEPSAESFAVCAVTPELLDAWLRLMRLMRTPADIPVLAPAYEREILYRVLQGPQGWVLRAIARPDSALSQIRRAVQWIREHFAQPFSAEELASVAGMSVSAFHRHFKAATSLSPLQYQKNVRLLHARSLLVARTYSATSVAFEVGYESPSQFSREYKRMFGFPPSHAEQGVSLGGSRLEY